MIFCGTLDRDRMVKSGAFVCPNCGKNRYCRHERIESWFVLFFIPLFRLEVVTEYLKCQDCRHCFKLPALLPFLPRGGYLPSDLRVELRSGASIEAVEQRLIESGVDRDTAQRVVREMVRDRMRFCSECQLSYQENVATCWKCGRELSKGKSKVVADLDDFA
jgi:zinc ribbon protein